MWRFVMARNVDFLINDSFSTWMKFEACPRDWPEIGRSTAFKIILFVNV